MSLFSQRCPLCREKLPADARACPHCTSAVNVGFIRCTTCGKSVSLASRQCGSCGTPLASQSEQFVFQDRWQRLPDQWAAMVTLRIPDTVLRHGVQVDEGIVTLLRRNGSWSRTLAPGYYEMDTLVDRLFDKKGYGDDLQAAMVDVGQRTLDYPLVQLRDKDGISYTCSVRLVAAADAPELFAQSFLVGTQVVMDAQVWQKFSPDVRALAQEVAAGRSVYSLLGSLDERDQAEAALLDGLRPVLAAHGISVAGLRLSELGGAAIEKVYAKSADLARLQSEYDLDRRINDLENKQLLALKLSAKEVESELDQINHQHGIKKDERVEAKRLWDLRSKSTYLGEVERLETELAKQRKRNQMEIRLLDHQLALMEAQHTAELTAFKSGETDKLKTVQEAAAMDRETNRHRHELGLKDMTHAQGLEHLQAQIRLWSRAEPLGALMVAPKDKQDLLLRVLAEQFRVPLDPTPLPSPPPSQPGFNASGETGAAMRAVAAGIVPAVGVVMAVQGGVRTAIGTCWAWKADRMVTNAHVVELVHQCVCHGVRCVVLFQGNGAPFDVLATRIHPAYRRVPGRPGIIPMPDAYDLGTLTLAGTVPQCLPVAPVERLQHLALGEPVGYIGFPSEEMAGGVHPQRPTAILKSGIVAGVSDWDQGHASPEKCCLIRHDMGIAGGASGSPMFNLRGEVVAVLSAGNMLFYSEVIESTESKGVFEEQQRRSPSGSLVNFAQRADLLSQLE